MLAASCVLKGVYMLDGKYIDGDDKVYDTLDDMFKNSENPFVNGGCIRYRFQLKNREEKVYDHLGKEYASESDMCARYGVERATYRARQNNGFSKEECLGVIPLINQRVSMVKVDGALTILHSVTNPYFECVLHQKHTILHHDDIVDYYRKNVLRAA